MFNRLRKLFGYDNSKEKREERYGAGQDAAAKLFKEYPEALVYQKIADMDLDPDDLYGQGVLDYAEEYRLLQKGIQQ